jgi:hypothetical protein
MNATEKFQVDQYLSNGGFFEKWMPFAQRYVLKDLIKGEEGAWFVERLLAIKRRIEQMPKTHDTNGQEDPVAHLKYFGGPVTAYITEKDVGDDPEAGWQPDAEQIQAYGRIGILPSYPEMGYICLIELIEIGIELDLHFEPTPISQIKAKEV